MWPGFMVFSPFPNRILGAIKQTKKKFYSGLLVFSFNLPLSGGVGMVTTLSDLKSPFSPRGPNKNHF